MESYNLTEAKAKLSSIISRVAFAKTRIAIKRKGKNVAVILPYEDYMTKPAQKDQPEGLIRAKNALAGFDGIDQFVEDIYKAREESTDRKVLGI
jgi:prevent-host-death family protein